MDLSRVKPIIGVGAKPMSHDDSAGSEPANDSGKVSNQLSDALDAIHDAEVHAGRTEDARSEAKAHLDHTDLPVVELNNELGELEDHLAALRRRVEKVEDSDERLDEAHHEIRLMEEDTAEATNLTQHAHDKVEAAIATLNGQSVSGMLTVEGTEYEVLLRPVDGEVDD